MQKIIEKYPIGFSWLMLLIQIFLGMGFFLFYRLFDFGKQLPLGFHNYDIYNLFYTIVAVAIVAVLGWWREAGFVRLENWRDYLFYIPPLGIACLILSPGFSPSAFRDNFALPSIVFYFLLSAREEVFSRGLIQHALSKRGEIYAIFMSAVFFGLIHTSTFLLGRAFPGDTILQVVRAIAFGVGFAGLRLRTRSIYPLILLHTLLNIFTFTTDASLADISWFSSSWYSALSPLLQRLVVFELPGYLLGLYGLCLIISSPAHSRSAGRAVILGHLIVSIPVFIIIIGFGMGGLIFGLKFSLIFLLIFLLIGFTLGWLWWSFIVPRWRQWALGQGVPAEQLQSLAVATGLVWPKGYVFERTEFKLNKKNEVE